MHRGFAGVLMMLVTALVAGVLIFYYMPSLRSEKGMLQTGGSVIETAAQLKASIEAQDRARLEE